MTGTAPSGVYVIDTPEDRELISALLEIRTQAEKLTETHKALRERLQQRAGNAKSIVLDGCEVAQQSPNHRFSEEEAKGIIASMELATNQQPGALLAAMMTTPEPRLDQAKVKATLPAALYALCMRAADSGHKLIVSAGA